MIYPVNYGYLKDGITMPDGEPIDAYVLGTNAPADTFTGRVAAVLRRREDEDKLIVVPEGAAVTREQIRRETNFCEQYFDSTVYMEVK